MLIDTELSIAMVLQTTMVICDVVIIIIIIGEVSNMKTSYSSQSLVIYNYRILKPGTIINM